MESTDRPSSAVSILGLGAMGAAIARKLADRGYRTTVWNRSPREPPAGAELAASAAEALVASPIALVCVLDQSAARETLQAAGSRLAGRVVVNLTSGTPAQAREIAAWLRDRGAEYLDGSIMADPENVGTAQTSFLYSGSQAGFESNRTLLESLGTTQYLGNDPGRAAVFFMALVAVGYETWLAYLDTLAYGEAEGAEATALASQVTGMFSAMTDLMDGMARAAEDHDHPPAAGPLNVHAALMGDVIASRRHTGGDSSQLERVKALVDGRVAAGHGGEGFSSLIEDLRPRKDSG